MYAEVFTTGARLLNEATASFEISILPQPGLRPIAINYEQWPRTEVMRIPKNIDVTNKQVAANRDYVLVFSSEAGIASVVDLKSTSVASG